MTCGRWLDDGPQLDGVEDRQNLQLDEIAETLTCADTGTHGGDDALGGGHADIRGQEQFFECFCRVGVDLSGTTLRCVGLLDDLLEAADDLLLGAV